jgi:hypothetical protein
LGVIPVSWDSRHALGNAIRDIQFFDLTEGKRSERIRDRIASLKTRTRQRRPSNRA